MYDWEVSQGYVSQKLHKTGSGSWIRTSDQVVNSHLLYR